MSLDFLLKSFSEEDVKPKKKEKELVSLAGALQRQRLRLKKLQKPRPASLNFNPSSIAYGFCMRAKVAQLAGKHTIWVDPPTPKELLMFDMGKKIHEIVQDYFWDTGMLEGEFKCRYCNEKFYARSPAECPSGHNRKDLIFREIEMRDSDYKIVGRSDGIVWLDVDGQEEKHIMDIKSIGNRPAMSSPMQICYEDLEEPKPDHLIQLNLYMRMSGIHKGHLLYVAKNSHQMKSFYREYTPHILEPYLAEIAKTLAWAEELKEGKRKDLPPTCDKAKCNCEII